MLSSTSSSEAARRGLIRFATLFAMTALLATGASEWLVRTKVVPQDSYASHISLLQRTEHTNAAFGDSHTARGFTAGNGFVNLAFPSEGVSHMAWKTAHHFADKTPGRVILQADPHLFAAYRLHRAFEPYPEIVATESRHSVLRIAEPRHRARLPGYWMRFIESGLRLESKVRQTPEGALLSPGDFSDLSPRAQTLEARKRARIHLPGPDHLIAPAQREYMEMLDVLTQEGAEICLVTYPVTKAYLDAVGAAHLPILRFFKREAARVGAVYVDARRTIQDQGLFRDPDHLNAHGAQTFSDLLTDSCFGAGRATASL